MNKLLIIFVCYLLEVYVHGVLAPENCDNDLKNCIHDLIQESIPILAKGIPAKGVEQLDPLKIRHLNLTLPGGLEINFHDGEVTGLEGCVVEKAKLAKDTLDVQIVCNVSVVGKYKSSGRLLMFHIKGLGDASIKCKTATRENGVKYIQIKDLDIKKSYDGSIVFNFSNLINGSPIASKAVLQFLNQNWRLVAEEFGDPIIEFGAAIVLQNLKNYLNATPLDRFFEV
ncbi:hypothetical protein ACJJTC_019720 [Scirpophaga incertulas]